MIFGVSSSYFIPEGLITTNPVSLSRALTFPPVHTTRLFFGSSRCNCTSSSFNFSSMSFPHLFQRIHSRSFDDKSLFVAFHECHKALDIPLIGGYCCAIFTRKDLDGKPIFQG